VKDDRTYLLHIRGAIERVVTYTKEGRDAFLGSPITQDAVVRNFEIIGEAAKSLSESFKGNHSGVPWKRISGMRDKVIHEYFGVDLRLVWEAVERDIPELRRVVESALEKTA
jgi:uncharacterized protein with HEPN domain